MGLRSREQARRSGARPFRYFDEATEEPTESGRASNADVDLRPPTLGPGLRARPIIPSWVPHRVRARNGPAYQVDVFSPPRQALLAALEEQ